MNTIKTVTESTIEIKKSTFICILIPVNSKAEIETQLSKFKELHPHARHHCYAYILGTAAKANDDGEPAGTAGKPILDVLNHHQLSNVFALVIRYFGGIKLGAGGLTRAYRKSTAQAIENATLIPLLQGNKITISFDYHQVKFYDFELQKANYQIIEKKFELLVKYSLLIPITEQEEFLKLVSRVNHLTKIEIGEPVTFTKLEE